MTSKAAAAKAEALEKPVVVEYADESFSILPVDDWPIDAIEAFEDDRVVGFLRDAMVEGDFERLKKGRTVRDLKLFVELVQEALGLGN